MISAVVVRTATSGHLRLTCTQIHGSCTSAPLTLALRMAPLSLTASPSAASPSRALRSLPLSVMLSGVLDWRSGSLSNRGTIGYFWASTPYSYADSRYLYFHSTYVNTKANFNKPYGLALRCVALCAFVNGASRSLRASNRWLSPVTTGRKNTGDIDKCA